MSGKDILSIYNYSRDITSSCAVTEAAIPDRDSAFHRERVLMFSELNNSMCTYLRTSSSYGVSLPLRRGGLDDLISQSH
jgi:hypothetical protein